VNEPYDPRLPILAELERDVTRAAESALGVPRAETPPRGERMHGGRRRLAGRQGGRVVRRALLLVALVLLVGATALAATGAFDGGGSDSAVHGPAFDAARGSADGGYRIVLHEHGQTLCRVVVTGANVASKCQRPPRRDQVQPLSALGTHGRFVFGIAGPGAHSIVIKVGGRRRRVPTHPVDAAAARAVGVDPRVRVFVADFAARSGSASQPPAIVAGRIDCSLTTAPVPACVPR
jgi:hypothetical protein